MKKRMGGVDFGWAGSKVAVGERECEGESEWLGSLVNTPSLPWFHQLVSSISSLYAFEEK